MALTPFDLLGRHPSTYNTRIDGDYQPFINAVLPIPTQDVEQADQVQLYAWVRRMPAQHAALTNEVRLGLPSLVMTSTSWKAQKILELTIILGSLSR